MKRSGHQLRRFCGVIRAIVLTAGGVWATVTGCLGGPSA